MKDAPCKGCEKRYLACHDKCETYQEYKREREAILAKKRKENDLRVVLRRDGGNKS